MSTAGPPHRDRALVDTKYRAYKRATERLADWLASTAPSADDGGVPPLPVYGAYGQVPSATVTRDQAGSKLGIAHYIKLTNVIINTKPRIEVPLEIIDVAEKALFARQERADLLRGTDLESDSQHQYFITILGEVCEKLKSHYHASKKKRDKVAESDSKDQGKRNLTFQVLDLDPLDSGSEGEANPTMSAPTRQSQANGSKNRKKKRKKAKKAVNFSEEEDPFFVLMCLLSDLKAMRKYVKELWQEYKQGKTDLITASLVTNATFDIIRTYEQDFPAISSLLSDYSGTMALMLSRKLGKDEGLDLFLHPKTALSAYNEGHVEAVATSLRKVSRLADLSFASAFYFLRGPRHMILGWMNGAMKITATNKDPFSTYRLGQADEPASERDSFRRDLRTLAHYAQSLYTGALMTGKTFDQVTHDHFTMQWLQDWAATGNRTIDLPQAFGAQLYLDIQKVLGQDSKRAFVELCAASEKTLHSIAFWKKHPLQSGEMGQKVAILSGNMVLQEYVASLVLEMKESAAKVRYFNGLSTMLMGKAMAELSAKLASPLELNPLQCGTILFQVIHALRDSGVALAQLFSTVTSVGRLYFASQLHRKHYKSVPNILGLMADPRSGCKVIIPEFQVVLKWADMDYLFQSFGIAAFFDGRLPEKNNDILEVAQGGAGEEVKVEGRAGPIAEAPEPGKVHFAKVLYSYEPVAVTHRLYYSKYMKFSERLSECGIYKWTLETLQSVLQNHSWDLDEQEGTNCGNPTKEKDGGYSQISILRRLKQALQSESRALHFDFLSFHVTCLQILRLIKEEFRQLVVETYGEGAQRDDKMGYFADALTLLINKPERGRGNDPLCLYDGPMGKGAGINLGSHTVFRMDRAVFTNKHHIAIDAIIQRFLEKKGCADRELKKMAKVWGLPSS